MSFSDESMASLVEYMQWMDIYISSRPPYFPQPLSYFDERISRLSLHPTAPFRISIPMLSAFLGKHTYTLNRASEVAPGWDGSTPILLDFKGWLYSDFTVTLGRCTRRQFKGPLDAPSDSDSGQVILGPHFITVREGSGPAPKDPSHDCENDHAEAGTTLRRQLDYNGRVSFSPSIGRPELQISLARSPIDIGSVNMLEVRLDVVKTLAQCVDEVGHSSMMLA